jgi:hypothetical protein
MRFAIKVSRFEHRSVSQMSEGVVCYKDLHHKHPISGPTEKSRLKMAYRPTMSHIMWVG